MFEKFVADLLTTYLGDYIKGLNTENLKIGIWSGDVVLDNLELKPRALEHLDLPFTVKEGLLGRLTLKIPWNNLKNEPVIVTIDRVMVLAGPREWTDWDDDEVKEQLYHDKMNKLRTYEEAKKAANQQGPGMGTAFAQRFATKIVDNLQVSIFNIHVRYEDDWGTFRGAGRWNTQPRTPGATKQFAVGLTLESLVARSTNPNWEPAFLHAEHDTVHKLITLTNLAVYWNSGDEPSSSASASSSSSSSSSLFSSSSSIGRGKIDPTQTPPHSQGHLPQQNSSPWGLPSRASWPDPPTLTGNRPSCMQNTTQYTSS
eukprot:TRINITY_DN9869_c0_g1_i1.p1 TRINITY_DN9869_c0_g1~~TRINITY_DN9869_c0_g1_i1.p1  ORF type:complete len:314 (+),score=86.57 TRINITY_DN9869_c0_g1_i1:66-1007(+)